MSSSRSDDGDARSATSPSGSHDNTASGNSPEQGNGGGIARRWRLLLILGFFAGVIGGGVYAGMAFVRYYPPQVSFMNSQAPGKPVHLVIQTVAQMGKGYTHTAWVSYWVKSPSGKWVHSTVWQLPSHTRVDVTAYNFDGGGKLRNQVFGRVTGTIGNTMTVNGKTVSVITHNSFYGESHTFSIPQLGVNVPFPAVNGNAPTFCMRAPCDPATQIHNTIKFSFMTGAPKIYHWQCFFPCAASYLDGNGGPMQTLGYMDGYLKVLPTSSSQHFRVGA